MSSEAPEENEPKKERVCRMFQLRICTRGKNCPDAHPGEQYSDSEDDGSVEETHNEKKDSDEEIPVCRYFLQNKCKRGDSCPFEHPDLNNESTAKEDGKINKEENLSENPNSREEEEVIEIGDEAEVRDKNFHPHYSRLEGEYRRDHYPLEGPYYEADLGRKFCREKHTEERYHEDIRSRYDHTNEHSIGRGEVRCYDDMPRHYSERDSGSHYYSEEASPADRDEFPDSDRQKRPRTLSPENEPYRKYTREDEPAENKSSNSSQPSEPDDKTKCKYFVRGLCKRGDKCPFVHDKPVEENLKEAKDWVKFCRKYRKGKCLDTKCRLLHISNLDRRIYKTTGVISEHALSISIRQVLRLDAPIDGKKCVCKDNLIGKCDVVNCPFLHYDRERFSRKVMLCLRSEFEASFGPIEGFDDLTIKEQKSRQEVIDADQNVILKKLFDSPASSPQPAQNFPVVAPVVPLWFPPPVISELEHSTAPEVDVDKTLADKLLIANAEIEKETAEYHSYMRKLNEENFMMYRVLNPDQPANHLDEIRLRLLEVCEEINWKSNSRLCENARDYQHKKAFDTVPDYPFSENEPLSRGQNLAPHQNEFNLGTDRLLQNFDNMPTSQQYHKQTYALHHEDNTVGASLWPDHTAEGSQSNNLETTAGVNCESEFRGEKGNFGDDYNKCDNYENEPMEVEDC